MFISIDEEATSWFTKEFEINKPFSIRMFPQYAGFGQKHKGYSLAFSAETPSNAGFIKEVNGISFFVEGNDVWFFEATETSMSINHLLDDLKVSYKDELVPAIN